MSFTLAIHGGAGTIRRTEMTPRLEEDYHAGLCAALRAGEKVLAAGGPALDAVTAAVMALEDNALFNAGRGAVYTSAGRMEMDAAVMEGRERRAGAVAGICGPRNPVLAAREVMEHSDHVLLAGPGAMAFLNTRPLTFEAPEYFATERRQEALQRELARLRMGGVEEADDSTRHGTVGAVACDADGNLAAATSTGGMTAKLPGRVGDSPQFGAGTFADNVSCAVSCTGHGEFFVRYAVAHEISARMRFLGEGLEVAAQKVIADLGPLGGSGGLVAVDARGNVSLPFNCSGMYRGQLREDGVAWTGIYRGELRAQGGPSGPA